MRRGVGFVKGAAFYADGSSDNTFRLNYSNAAPIGSRKAFGGWLQRLRMSIDHPLSVYPGTP